MSIRSWFHGLLTGADNTTPSPARHGWLLGNVGVLATAVMAAFKGVQVDLVQLATAFGIINAAGGGAALAEHSSQPQPEKSTTIADAQGDAVVVTKTQGGA